MVTDQQVRRVLLLMKKEKTQAIAAAKAGMDVKTARKYTKLGKLPSEVKKQHTWGTRSNPFRDDLVEIKDLLKTNPGLQSKTIFDYLQRKEPGKYQDGQLRTLQRYVKRWRALEGPAREIFFPQVHYPGKLSASDFTHMSKLGVTIRGELFKHLVYHFVLTYSNWEYVKVCFGESFESLSAGYQGALWELGGVPKKHRTDRMSSAVNKECNPDKYTQRYSSLMNHYGVTPERTNSGRGNENGDVEQRHSRFKTAVDQSLMLRGSRNFGSREEYEGFLQDITKQLNAGRQKRFKEELNVLGRLPVRKLDNHEPIKVSVNPSSTIRVLHNTYSVHSRLRGEKVTVKAFIDHLEVWYAQRKVDRLPRLRGENKHKIQYHHIIDWLVRKPGAFKDYRYKPDLFPSSHFRMAYDHLKRENPLRADKEYVNILYVAAKEGESLTESAIRHILSQEQTLSVRKIKEIIEEKGKIPPVTDVTVEDVPLSRYDELLETSKKGGNSCIKIQRYN